MMRMFAVVSLAWGLMIASTPSMAMMHGMTGMSEPGMYNLTIGGLAGTDDAKGIDEKFRRMKGVAKVHVDFKNGMIMVWMKKGSMLDRGMAERIVKAAGLTLDEFEAPE